MTAEELWRKFCDEMKIDETTPYETWSFGGEADIADALLELVLVGRKFGTASAYDEYFEEDTQDELPQVGDYSVLLKSGGEAVCVIKNYDVYIRSFESVPPFHAYAEGEANRSLESWREIHTKFFRPRLELTDKPLDAKSLIVCEKFTVEYTAECGMEKADELFFVEPSMTYAEEISSYREEMLAAESSFDGCLSMKRMPDPKEYTEYCTEWANPSRILKENEASRRTILANCGEYIETVYLEADKVNLGRYVIKLEKR